LKAPPDRSQVGDGQGLVFSGGALYFSREARDQIDELISWSRAYSGKVEAGEALQAAKMLLART